MRRISQYAAIFTLFVVSLGRTQPAGKIVYVDNDASGAGNGTSWDDAFLGLEQALDSSRSGDQIWVAEGTYQPAPTRSSSFRMKNGVAIYGGFEGTENALGERDWVLHPTILSGDIGVPGNTEDNCYHVVANNGSVLDSSAILDGFTITRGHANGSYPDDRGGGILNISGSPSFLNCLLESNNATERGGGMQNISSAPRIEGCTIRANSAFEGGGMANYSSSPRLVRVTFFGNGGAYGGGLCNDQGSSPTLEDCSFELNDVYDSGGAMSMHEGCAAEMRRCVFRANIAEYGSGGAVWHWYAGTTTVPVYIDCVFELNYNNAIACRNSAFRVEKSLFADNIDPTHDGGAILVAEDSSPILVNCTFTGNWAPSGRAIACNYNPVRPSRVILANCILWDGGSEVVNDDNSRVIVAYSDVTGGYPGTANIFANPMFADQLHHDFSLLSSSPAIDAGTAHFVWNDTTIVSLDSSRYFGLAPDMGAYEWRSLSLLVPVTAAWNLVSVPLQMNDYQRSSLFPAALTQAYTYVPGSGYVGTDTLQIGPGYWLKFPALGVVTMSGFSLDAESVVVRTGWNLIGSISTPVAVDSIQSIPGGIVTSQFIGFSPVGYRAVSLLESGFGYWVKVNEPGKLILAAGSSAGDRIHIVATTDRPPSPPSDALAAPTAGIPVEFALGQNYPNPFNPATTIRFSIPAGTAGRTSLQIHDLLGREVATLVNEPREPGVYTVTFDASHLASGVYVYRLTTGEYATTKRMMLVK